MGGVPARGAIVSAALGWTLLVALAPEGELDHTGIRWAMPFRRARERAKAEQRLLLIKPIAFGTEKSGGW